ALRALRNLFHHEAELVHEVRIVPAAKLPPIVSDLPLLCLVKRPLVERAVDSEVKRDRGKHGSDYRDRMVRPFKWYGSVVNIQPCLFNAAVDVFEEVQKSGIAPFS